MDFSYICKYCNRLFEISLEKLPTEIRALIIEVKSNEKENLKKSNIDQNLIKAKSSVLSQNSPSSNMEINGIDMSFVRVDHISISDIITNLNLILKDKICDSCYKKLSKINEDEIKRIDEEMTKLDNCKIVLEEEIDYNEEAVIKEKLKNKSEDAKAQEEASKRLNDDNLLLQKDFDDYIKQLKDINEKESQILDKINNLNLDTLLISKEYELEKSIQQKNQFEQISLLNTNILEFLFDIQINEKYGTINGCKMQFKNYSSFNDIFAGWGHILYLTKILILKVKKILGKLDENDIFKIYTWGDYSYIYNSQERQKFFFYEKNSSLNDDAKAKNLNKSMKQYLIILKNLDDNVTKINQGKGLNNFVIKEKSINNYPIELNIYYQNDLEWAACMKSLLILLKYYINIVAKKDNEEMKKIIDNKI